MSKKLSKKELKELEALQAEAWIKKWPTLKKDKDGNLVGCSEAEAGPDKEAYGGPKAIESYLQYIDQLTKELANDKGSEHFHQEIAHGIQNAIDDIRKHLKMEPTNLRTKFKPHNIKTEYPNGPDSVEDVIDNIKEEKAEDLMEHFKEIDRLDEIRL